MIVLLHFCQIAYSWTQSQVNNMTNAFPFGASSSVNTALWLSLADLIL